MWGVVELLECILTRDSAIITLACAVSNNKDKILRESSYEREKQRSREGEKEKGRERKRERGREGGRDSTNNRYLRKMPVVTSPSKHAPKCTHLVLHTPSTELDTPSCSRHQHGRMASCQWINDRKCTHIPCTIGASMYVHACML